VDHKESVEIGETKDYQVKLEAQGQADQEDLQAQQDPQVKVVIEDQLEQQARLAQLVHLVMLDRLVQ
jgi:hypothetical protein